MNRFDFFHFSLMSTHQHHLESSRGSSKIVEDVDLKMDEQS